MIIVIVIFGINCISIGIIIFFFIFLDSLGCSQIALYAIWI